MTKSPFLCVCSLCFFLDCFFLNANLKDLCCERGRSSLSLSLSWISMQIYQPDFTHVIEVIRRHVLYEEEENFIFHLKVKTVVVHSIVKRGASLVEL